MKCPQCKSPVNMNKAIRRKGGTFDAKGDYHCGVCSCGRHLLFSHPYVSFSKLASNADREANKAIWLCE